jgi:flagellar biosynthetic protein FlhB
MAGSTGERTEKPTQRRLRDARERGQVARSRDLAQAAALLAAMGVFAWMGSSMMGQLGDTLIEGLSRVGRHAVKPLAPLDLMPIVVRALMVLLAIVGPIAITSAIASIGIQTVQGGWMFAPAALKLNWSRLNPASGLSRLGFGQGGVDTLKTVVGLVALVSISYLVLAPSLLSAEMYAQLSPVQAAMAGWELASRLLRYSAIALFVIAGADYLVQRWRFTSSLKMTKAEVRDDMKLTEGRPEIKGRIRRMQRDLARRRMMADVKRATVVITNPTEYAVALEYRRETMVAPTVVAKGRGVLAARIKAIAREHDIPTVENVPLAQALYKAVEVGQTIPGNLFDAVAEVLAYLIRLKRLAF